MSTNQLSILTNANNDDGHDIVMRWGPHKDTKMRDLPKHYLTKLYNSKTIGGDLREYLNKNYSILMRKA